MDVGGYKMKIAAVTMVYNEPEYLPIWCRYYGSILGPENCYVIDHGTDDGSIDPYTQLGFNILRIPRSPKDNTKRTRFISNFCSNLLEWHDAVFHSDVDEIIFPDPQKYESLTHYAETISREGPISAIGFDIHHSTENEPNLNLDQSVMEQRSWIRFSSSMCKPVLLFSPINWSPGFHSANARIRFNDLYLFHLRYFDLNLGLRRLFRTRAMPWSSENAGSHQRLSDEDFTNLVQRTGRLPKTECAILGKEDPLIAQYIEKVLASEQDYKTNTYPLDLHIFGTELFRIPNDVSQKLANAGI